jgi:hypothetical protein
MLLVVVVWEVAASCWLIQLKVCWCADLQTLNSISYFATAGEILLYKLVYHPIRMDVCALFCIRPTLLDSSWRLSREWNGNWLRFPSSSLYLGFLIYRCVSALNISFRISTEVGFFPPINLNHYIPFSTKRKPLIVISEAHLLAKIKCEVEWVHILNILYVSHFPAVVLLFRDVLVWCQSIWRLVY